jgi:hypothetical protein
MKSEQELANELDAFLTARLNGRPFPSTEDVSTEVDLADALLDLAAAAEPDPVFLSSLEAHLARAASRQQQQKLAPKRPPSFWQQILNSVKEDFTMKRTVFAFGGIAALIIIGFFAFNVLFKGDGVEPSAIAEVTELDTPETAVTTESTAPQATPDTSNLAPLPNLTMGGGAGGRGGGGGGGEEISLAAGDALTTGIPVEDFRIYDPLYESEYVLNTTLPTDPAFTAVYQQADVQLVTIEDVQRFITLFNMNSPVYAQVFPAYEPAPGEPVWEQPTYYFAFDGYRSLSVWGNSVNYYDQGAAPNYEVELMLFDQAAPIAESFLKDRGLLDFEYELRHPVWDSNTVEIYRVTNGRTINVAEYTVSVTVAGQILSVYYNPLTQLQALGDYPLRTAAEAWQLITTEGIDYQRSYYITYPGPNYEYPEEPEVVDGPYKYWQRQYQDGDSITVISSPQVYRAVNGDAAPRIQLDQFLLSGNSDILNAIADTVGQQIQVTGIIRGTGSGTQMIEARDWSIIEYVEYQYQTGTIRRADGQVYLDADNGQTYVIPNAPEDLADGERVNVNGWTIEAGNVFNWNGIDRFIEYDPSVEELSIDSGIYEPYKIGRVEITSVDITYLYSPVYEEGQVYPTVLIQPAWRFKGNTDTNEIIEIYVQAVADDFVTTTGSQNP